MNRSTVRKASWVGIGLSAFFAVIVGGTVYGDHVISNDLHGDTMEKRTALCTKTVGERADPKALDGCITEKTRGFTAAAAAHTRIRGNAIPAMVIVLPLSVAGLYLTKGPKQS